MDESAVKQIVQWKAHVDAITNLKIINLTNEPLIFTSSYDRMAKLWVN